MFAAALSGAAAAGELGPDGHESLPAADVVILGEVHDNPHHHAAQAEALAVLQPSAIVFEMLTPDQARAVTADVRGDEVALSRAVGWVEAGWPDFAMYFPIFGAAPEAAIHGAGVTRDEARRAVAEGAAPVLGDAAEMFGLDEPLDDAEMEARIAEQAEAHCNSLPEELLPGMVQAQRVRDAALARATIAAFDEAGGPVAVITGNGHADRDRGVPAYIGRARPELSVVSVGQLEVRPDSAPPFDFWRVTEPAEREDPCLAFQ